MFLTIGLEPGVLGCDFLPAGSHVTVSDALDVRMPGRLHCRCRVWSATSRLPQVCSIAVSTCKATTRNMVCTKCSRLHTLLLRKYFSLASLPQSLHPFWASPAELACGVSVALLLTYFLQCGVQIPAHVFPPRARPHR